MPETLFRNVRLLDLQAHDGLTAPCDLLVRDGRIAEIGAPSPRPMRRWSTVAAIC